MAMPHTAEGTRVGSNFAESPALEAWKPGFAWYAYFPCIITTILDVLLRNSMDEGRRILRCSLDHFPIAASLEKKLRGLTHHARWPWPACNNEKGDQE